MFFFLWSIEIVSGTPRPHTILYVDSKPTVGAQYSIESLPLDPMLRVMEFLFIDDIQSMKRSCKTNLRLCRQYIHSLISSKFRYLLDNEPSITIDHLIRIPLIDSMKTDIRNIPFYFGKNNRTNSVYIGFINNTNNNAFISFWIQRFSMDHSRHKSSAILTFVFNETGIDSVYFCKRMSNLARSQKIRSLWYRNSDMNDMEAIHQLLCKGTITQILNCTDLWYLDDFFDALNYGCSLCLLEVMVLVLLASFIGVPLVTVVILA